MKVNKAQFKALAECLPYNKAEDIRLLYNEYCKHTNNTNYIINKMVEINERYGDMQPLELLERTQNGFDVNDNYFMEKYNGDIVSGNEVDDFMVINWDMLTTYLIEIGKIGEYVDENEMRDYFCGWAEKQISRKIEDYDGYDFEDFVNYGYQVDAVNTNWDELLQKVYNAYINR